MARWRCIILYICALQIQNSLSQRDQTIHRDAQCWLDADSSLGMGHPGQGRGQQNIPRIPNDRFWAASFARNRDPFLARLGATSGAWTAKIQNAYQFLAVDLGKRYIISKIATQGRQGSEEFVTEYVLEFSDDRKTWKPYTNEYGIVEMFIGNDDGHRVKTTVLKYPIVAQYLKFRPQRWNMFISMRVEAYGCPYVSEPVNFDGQSYISYDVSHPTSNVKTTADTLSLRLRTNNADGVVFYADGNQGDYFALEMYRGYLYLRLDLGSTQSTRGVTERIGGSMLDDSNWHDVIVKRNRTNIRLVVDRLETVFETNGLFFRLDLDKKIYLGGVHTVNQDGLTVRYNFTGCMENVVFDGIHMIRDSKPRPGAAFQQFQRAGNVAYQCGLGSPIPVTFPSLDSFLFLTGYSAGGPIKVKLQFRSHDEGGLLVHHKMDVGEVKVILGQQGFVEYTFTSNSGQRVADVVRNTDLESPTTSFADGMWHSLTIYIDTVKVNVTVDRNSKVSLNLQLAVSAGSNYYIGGSPDDLGFRGCMREINLATTPVILEALGDSLNGANVGSCGIVDRCIPSPCEHGNQCTQNWDNFYCNCSRSGYMGEVCRVSSYYLSCEMHKYYSSSDGPENVMIDPDGSGPLKPFKVVCNGKAEMGKPVETKVHHNAMELTTVNGYQSPNYYVKNVNYTAELPSLTQLIERAQSCYQDIYYECSNARLLAKPGDVNYPHFGWWVGRTFQPMYYWGGAAPGSGKCECGLTEVGCMGGQTTCNCDSGRTTSDSGQLKHKIYLPVLELHFGDTGTVSDNKLAKYKLGELVCQGDDLLDNVVTFRKADATIEFGTFEAAQSGDIWFQFRTTARDGVMLHNTGTVDFIEVRLVNGENIQFRYNVGNGEKVLESGQTSALNNDQWHTVHIERNRKQAWLRVDDSKPETQNVAHNEVTRLLDLSSELVVGAAVDYRNGFVGCMRGLRVNGRLMDMRGLVRRGEVTYGVAEGCTGKCASNPCMNGGTCREGYAGYNCDCAYTPFRGWMCGREVGINLLKSYMVKYTFDENQGLSATDFMFIKVGFSTKQKTGILIQLRDATNKEYISLEMNNNGGVKFVVDVGFYRFEINTRNMGIDFANGQQHEARVKRTGNGRLVTIQVDNYPEESDFMGQVISDSILDDPKYLYVGNNDTTNPQRGFEGCIFRMQIDNIFPLKRAFQDPRPSFVELFPLGQVREDMCGFEEMTQPPDPIEVRPVGGALYNVTYPTFAVQELTSTVRGIIGGVFGFVALVVIIIIIFVVIYIKPKGDYETKEAKGTELADNPDAAVVYNQTGLPDIAKRQEWFI